ncbi:hypothetical protein [Arsukibacterium sp.]|uniref:hypothetical protein n=1 Tax=Arsukibacterium sp. TaxID=1977258 RepID=UPI001BD1FA83|nr:hypothetical protein [Arsukibacterium sp.]
MDEFSEKIANKFRSQFPRWISYCGAVNRDGAVIFEAKIPFPGSKRDAFLTLATDNQEVTVYLDSYHAHFDDFGENNSNSDALVFVQKIISNEYVVVSYWRDSQWCGSEHVPINALPTGNEEYPYANLVKMYSWLGNYDNEIHYKPRG